MANNDTEALALGCTNGCSYSLENDANQKGKYCFKPGNQESKCLSTVDSLTAINGNAKVKRFDCQKCTMQSADFTFIKSAI